MTFIGKSALITEADTDNYVGTAGALDHFNAGAAPFPSSKFLLSGYIAWDTNPTGYREIGPYGVGGLNAVALDSRPAVATAGRQTRQGVCIAVDLLAWGSTGLGFWVRQNSGGNLNLKALVASGDPSPQFNIVKLG